MPICEIVNGLDQDCPHWRDYCPDPYESQINTFVNQYLANYDIVYMPEAWNDYGADEAWVGYGMLALDNTTGRSAYGLAGFMIPHYPHHMGENEIKFSDGGATICRWTVIGPPDLYCFEVPEPITVFPSAPGDLYWAGREDLLTFTVPRINYIGRPGGQFISCGDLGFEENREIELPFTIRNMYDLWGAGDYTIVVGPPNLSGDCNLHCLHGEKTFTIFGLVSETVSTIPGNRIRTTLGIGEEVVVSTEPEMDMHWEVVGGGSVDLDYGPNTTFTASQSPSTSIVTATSDGGSSGDIQFKVKAPDGMESAALYDQGCGLPGPPNDWIGAYTIFTVTVLPTDVSFYNAHFQENIPFENWIWPDGYRDGSPPELVPWDVDYANQTTDDLGYCDNPISRLDPLPPGGGYVDFQIDFLVPEEYQNESGVWIQWLPDEVHHIEYRGIDGAARNTLEASNISIGAWQGPWQ